MQESPEMKTSLDTREEMDECLVCLESLSEKLCVVLPCGHWMCATCGETEHKAAQPKCPKCKDAFTDLPTPVPLRYLLASITSLLDSERRHTERRMRAAADELRQRAEAAERAQQEAERAQRAAEEREQRARASARQEVTLRNDLQAQLQDAARMLMQHSSSVKRLQAELEDAQGRGEAESKRTLDIQAELEAVLQQQRELEADSDSLGGRLAAVQQRLSEKDEALARAQAELDRLHCEATKALADKEEMEQRYRDAEERASRLPKSLSFSDDSEGDDDDKGKGSVDGGRIGDDDDAFVDPLPHHQTSCPTTPTTANASPLRSAAAYVALRIRKTLHSTDKKIFPKESRKKYTMQWKLGPSLSSRVTFAEHSNGSLCAIKALPLASDRNWMHSFREVMLLYTLGKRHANGIVPLDNVYRRNNHLYLVMPMLQRDLASILDDPIHTAGLFSEQMLLSFARQMVTTLHFIHSSGVAHRAISPSVILCDADEDGVVTFKLGGWGYAMSATTHTATTVPIRPVSRVPTDMQYQAPELLYADGATDWMAVDMWALGCILVECTLQQQPFHGKSAAALLTRICEHQECRCAAEGKQRSALHQRYPIVRAAHAQSASSPSISLVEQLQQASGLSEPMTRFIVSMLQWDPRQRLTSRNAVHCDCFEDGGDAVVRPVTPIDEHLLHDSNVPLWVSSAFSDDY